MPIIYSSKPLPARREYDLYETPKALVEAVVTKFYRRTLFIPRRVLDPGAGNGVWGKEVSKFYMRSPLVDGVEVRSSNKPRRFHQWFTQDYLMFHPEYSYDLIVGNPPYKLAEDFVRKSYDLLEPQGYLLFLLRLSFLEGIQRHMNLYSTQLRPKEVWVSPRRVSFTEDKRSNETAYAMFLWQKEWEGVTSLDWVSWDYNIPEEEDDDEEGDEEE